jgi:hypothetical protein
MTFIYGLNYDPKMNSTDPIARWPNLLTHTIQKRHLAGKTKEGAVSRGRRLNQKK